MRHPSLLPTPYCLLPTAYEDLSVVPSEIVQVVDGEAGLRKAKQVRSPGQVVIEGRGGVRQRDLVLPDEVSLDPDDRQVIGAARVARRRLVRVLDVDGEVGPRAQ